MNARNLLFLYPNSQTQLFDFTKGTMIIYIYKKCSTCQAALRFLEGAGVTATIKEIDKTPPSVEELQTLLKHNKGQIKKIINTSGIVYRKLKLSEKIDHMESQEVLQLLSGNGMLIKRPILFTGEKSLVGFREKEWSAFFLHP